MLIKYAFLSFIHLISGKEKKFEPFIVGGQDAEIENHPHSAFMSSSCQKAYLTMYYRCGSSILNQWILLSAAHCFDCAKAEDVTISVGSSFNKGQFITSLERFIVHPDYRTVDTSFDLAVMKVKRSLPLGKKVSRVALMRNPPRNEIATVAGWGLVNEYDNIATNYLKFIRQKVLSKHECLKILGRLPEGCLCAGTRHSPSYVALGDSGSALVVRGFIQIGLVSFKDPQKSISVVVFTDTSYFYDWILTNANRLYCRYQ